ncbi:Ger(x)C family spore germination protein [Sutcliffiella horikoshii]|uniref:Ger(X)C family spore germination protein n=1 Tax=Sutcliffiella horikoshii TaxID=79883 RepID=A0A5D4THI2_9BACI|nr:Ger(x)C family spore germination protein [Sutcliffiella horikoshii]TYS73526.1 Ger(x)C family spore germination protein [Sutcliffiella horikoshii]
MPHHNIIWVITICLFLTGCLEKEIVDDINIESVEGFDLIGENKVEGTFVVPVYKADQTIENEKFTAISLLNKDILRNAQKESSAPIVNGSLELVLFNKALAEKGVLQLVDGLQRDASIGTGLYLAIVEGETKELLQQNFGTRGIGDHLYNLLKHNIDRRDVPKTNLHIFLSDFYQEGKDPNLPILKKTEDSAEIVGLAVMKEDKYEMTIPNEKLFYFKTLVDKHSNGTVSLEVDGKEEFVSIRSINTDRKFKVKWEGDTPSIYITVSLDGAVREYTGNKVTPKEMKEFQKVLEKKIIKESESMIKEFQEKGVDPIGLGYQAKSRKRGFDYKKWKDETYPTLTVKVKAEVRLISTGITE